MDQSWARFLPPFIRARLEGRQGLQNIIGNTGWLFANTFVRMGVGLVVNVWMARYLGPQQFGLFCYAIAFVTLFSALARLGLDNIVIRDLVRDPSCRDETLGTAFVLRFCGGVATFLASVAAISLLRPGDDLAAWLVGIAAAGTVFQAFDTIDLWFQSLVRAKYTVLARSVPFLLVSLAKVALILLKAPLMAFAWVVLAEIVLGSAGLVVVYRLHGHRLSSWGATLQRAKSLMRDCWPLIFSGLATMVYLRIDQVMLSQMAGDREVGVYSAAVKLAEAWYFIPMAISSSVAPAIVEAGKAGDDLFYSRLQKLFNLMAFLGYAVAVPTTFLGGWVVRLLYGEAYSAAGPMLSVLIWSVVFINLGVARGVFITTMNWAKFSFYTVSLGAVINVALNFLLIPRYGGMGAAIASCVSYWMAVHGACFFHKPLFRIGGMMTKAMVYPRVW